MKKLLPFLGIAILIAACNTMPQQKTSDLQSQKTISQPDTTGLASFNAWKAQNELANEYQQPQQTSSKTRTVIKYVPVKSKSISHTSVEQSSGSISNESSQTAKIEKKTGWSKAAKGAVIGGVAGVAGGAIIDKKNRVVGAVIGGILGAAGGYGIGHTMDKNDDRIAITQKF